MKKILLGLLVAATLGFTKEHTVADLTTNPAIEYIMNIDGTKDVKIDLYSNSLDSIPLSKIKLLINTLKNKKDIRNVLIDFDDVSTVKDYMQSSITKEQVDWEKNKVNILLKISEKNNDFTKNVSEELFRNKCIEFASNGFLGIFNKFDTNLCNKVKYTNGAINFGDAVPSKYTKDFDEYLKVYMHDWNIRVNEKHPKELKIKYSDTDTQ